MSMGNLPLVAILILNWNGMDVTYNCILSIIRNTDYPRDKLKIVVIDNGSSDGSYHYLKRKLYPLEDTVIVMQLKKIIILLRETTCALEHFDPDYILLLNNDIEIIQKDWLRNLYEVAKSDDKIAIVGSKLIFPDGIVQYRIVQWIVRKKKRIYFLILQTIAARLNPWFGEHEEKAVSANFISEANTLSGVCMIIRAEFIKRYGKLDVSLYPMYQEDIEYLFRSWRVGYKVVYVGGC